MEDTTDDESKAPKDGLSIELMDALQAVAVQFKAHIYGNAVEPDSPNSFQFDCDGSVE